MTIENAFLNHRNKFLHWVLLLVAFGAVILRLTLYLNGADFILDEVNSARNLQERDFSHLTHPLDYQQHAPILFLFVSKTIALSFGYSEQVLRLLPLVSGIVNIYLFFKILKQKKYGFIACIVGLLLFGFNVVLLQYSLTFKQYNTDLLITLLLLYWYPKSQLKPNNPGYYFGGIVAIFFSMPSIFVLLWFAVSGYILTRKSAFIRMGVLWLTIFCSNYYLFLQPSIVSDHLQSFHSGFFLPMPIDSHSLSQFLKRLIMVFTGVFGKTFLALLLAISMVLWGWTRNKQNLLLGLPILLLLGAALLHKYSLIDRLILFIYPFILLLFLEGFNHAINSIYSFHSKFKHILGLILLIATAVILASSNRFQYLPSNKAYGTIGVYEGFQTLKTAPKDNCQILTHNAAPFYAYYVNRGILVDQNLPIMSWDHREFDYQKSSCDVLTIIDVHTFGSEKDMLTNKLIKYKEQITYTSRDMSIITVN